jgi:hypothetical protein
VRICVHLWLQMRGTAVCSRNMKRLILPALLAGVLASAGFQSWAGPQPDPAGTTATRAGDFLNSIGVCVHIAQGVDNPTNVAASMGYAGIRNLRDDGSSRAATIQGWIHIHNACGAKVCLLPINGDVAKSVSMYESLAAAGALLAVEGPNEPNNSPVTYGGAASSKTNSLPVAWFQRDLCRAVKSDPKLAGIPVFAASEAGGSQPNNCGLQFLTIPAGAGTLMPDGTVYADFANTHNYVCDHLSGVCDNNAWDAEDPAVNGRWDGMYVEYGHTWWSPGYSGYSASHLPTVPRVTTETGWLTQGKDAISEEQQAALFLNLYLAAFKRGWSYTFIYMLRDDPVQGYWGLFHKDYSPKRSAICLHNLTTILADKPSSATARSLNYSISGEPATVHDLLLQKGNGAFELVVWSEKAAGSNDVTVNLGAPFANVRVYNPTIGTVATQTPGKVASIRLSLTDHPMIIEILTTGAVGEVGH